MNPDDPADVVEAAIAALQKHGKTTIDLTITLESQDVASIVGRWPPDASEKANPALIKTDKLFAAMILKLGTIGEHGNITTKLNAFRNQISVIGALPDDLTGRNDDHGDYDLGSIVGPWPDKQP